MKKKKILIPVIIVLVLGLAVGAYFIFRPQSTQAVKYSYIRTVTLSNGSLESVVTASGSVKSSDTSTVTASTNAKVKAVNVAVGDTVKAGDVLVELDTADLLEKIASEEQSLADRIKRAQDTLTTAKENLDSAESEYSSYVSEKAELWEEYEAATERYEAVVESVAPFKKTADETYDVMQAAGLEYNEALQTDTDVAAKKSAYDDAYGTYQTAKNAYHQAQQNCDYDGVVNSYQSARSAYEKVISSINQAAKAIDQADEAVNNAEENLEEIMDSDTLDELKEDLEACYLKAETDGKVTSLSATVGSSPMGTVATIQNTNKLKVVISVSETDVNKLTLGMACRIESDATDKSITGKLTQLDPVSSNSGNFGAEVTVETEDSGLLIGMNASVDIILSSTETDGFSVPLDAVGEDETGSFVYRKTGGSGVDMTFEKVYVTLGEQNDYYTVIEGEDLSVGDVIRATADLTEGIEETTASESGGFNLGDLFGGGSQSGNMPTPPSGSGSDSFSGGNFSGGGSFSGGERPSGNFGPRG